MQKKAKFFCVLAVFLMLSFSFNVMAGNNKKETLKVKQVSCGQAHTIIVKTDNTMWACGNGSGGELGDGKFCRADGKDYICKRPKLIMTNVAQVDTSSFSTAIVKTDGTLWMCGTNEYGKSGVETPNQRELITPAQVMSEVAQVEVADYFTAIIKKDGSLWMCGSFPYGDLAEIYDTSIPVQVMTDVKQVSGERLTIGIVKKDGSLWMWGDNEYGQLGDGTTEYRSHPVKVMTDVEQVKTDGYTTMILKKDGTLWTCGDGSRGDLGNGVRTDNMDSYYVKKPVKVLTDVAQLSNSQSLAVIKKDGSLWQTRVDNSGRFVKTMTNVAQFSGNEYWYAVLKKDGTLWTCGLNSDGQLGTGDKKDRQKPVKIIDDRNVKTGKVFKVGGNKYKLLSISGNTVAFIKAKNKKTVTIPATVKFKGAKYKVIQINANSFKSSKATKIILKTDYLTKKSVKNSLKGSKVKTVQVSIGTKEVNKAAVKAYKKFFTKKVVGKKVKIK